MGEIDIVILTGTQFIEIILLRIFDAMRMRDKLSQIFPGISLLKSQMPLGKKESVEHWVNIKHNLVCVRVP